MLGRGHQHHLSLLRAEGGQLDPVSETDPAAADFAVLRVCHLGWQQPLVPRQRADGRQAFLVPELLYQRYGCKIPKKRQADFQNLEITYYNLQVHAILNSIGMLKVWSIYIKFIMLFLSYFQDFPHLRRLIYLVNFLIITINANK